MADYRLYCLDGSGHITQAELIVAVDDNEARLAARALKKPHKCELWLGNSCIAVIPAKRASA